MRPSEIFATPGKDAWFSAALACFFQRTTRSTIIRSIFGAIGADESELMRLLKDVVEDREVDDDRIREIAAGVAPHLPLPRGPKVSSASAAYEFICNPELSFKIPSCRHPTYEKRAAEYINPLTAAIRLEFNQRVSIRDRRSAGLSGST